jgi:hypothetical protein
VHGRNPRDLAAPTSGLSFSSSTAERTLVDATYSPDTSAADREELEHVVASLRCSSRSSASRGASRGGGSRWGARRALVWSTPGQGADRTSRYQTGLVRSPKRMLTSKDAGQSVAGAFLDAEEVRGSSPLAPTKNQPAEHIPGFRHGVATPCYRDLCEHPGSLTDDVLLDV